MLDNVDNQILNELQKGIPIVSEPYKVIADEIGISVDELFQRINKLKEDGIIRRISAFFNSKKLGYKSLLCAAKVPGDNIRKVADIINEYPGITHNYLRDYDYNMWFTLIAGSDEEIDMVLRDIESRGNIGRILRLPATEMFKVKVQLNIGENNG